VYFGVKKSAEQTVTVQSADWQTPESTTPVTAENELADGAIDDAQPLTASETLAVFKVDAYKVHDGKRTNVADDEDALYDTQFEGDDFQFTLAVSGGGTVTVNLRADVTLDNALFIVNTTTGALSRVSGITHITSITGTGPTMQIVRSEEPGTTVLDVLAWADENYFLTDDGSGEYLVRVMNSGNEAVLPPMTFTFGVGNTTTKLRLRGTGGEQKLKWDGLTMRPGSGWYINPTATTSGSAVNKPGYSMTETFGLLAMRRGILQLERNITIQGTNNASESGSNRYLIAASDNASVIMKNGSAVKGHIGSGQTTAGLSVISITGGTGYTGMFKMEGGEISGNSGIPSAVGLTGDLKKSASLPYTSFFIKTGGSITGNTATDLNLESRDRISFGMSNYPKSFPDANYIDIEEGKIYRLPEGRTRE
jgi:hypothetical protein